MNATSTLRPSASSPLRSVRAVGDDFALLHVLAFLDDRLLVDAGAGVRAHELAQLVDVDAVLRVVLELLLAVRHFAVLRDDDLVGGDAGDFAGAFRDDDRLGIARDLAFHAGADERRLGDEQRHALALHVRAHQRAVRVIVLEERDQAGGHGDELLRRDVHVVDLRRLDFEEVAAITHGNFVREELAFLVDLHVRLRHEVSPEPSTWVVLVEGPPDMISARSRGLPAIAVPGDDAWEREWAQLLVGRYVSVVLDCDRAGREAAARIAGDLKAAGVRGSIIDLARDAAGWLRPDRLAERRSGSHRRGAAPGARRARRPRAR